MRVALVAVLFFLIFSALLVPYAGLQDDEIVFANPLNRQSNPNYCFTAFGRSIPLMIQPYAGTLKTALYWPLLHIVRPSRFSARLPMVFAGALTVLLFYKWSKRIAGTTAALVGTFLFATDPSFLLTNTFDWGPVALQLLLTVAGCWLIAKGRIVWGAFLFGLAMWNKAVFLWTIAGLTAGTIAAFWPEVHKALRRRRVVASAMCAFLVGALPLLIYNVRQRNATLGSSAHLSLQDSRVKLVQLRSALAGSSLFGYLVSEEDSASAKPATSPQGRAAAWIREHCGNWRASFFPIVLLLSLAAAPSWWRSPGRRAAVFALISAAVMFLAMLVTRDAGGAVHHIVLLWPMPQLFAGVAIASLRPRWLLASCAAIAVIGNVLVLNQYLTQFERNGAAVGFSDAAYKLSGFLSESPDTIYVIDWGISNSLDFLHSGRLNLRGAAEPLLSENPSDPQRREIDGMLRDPSATFLDHVQGREFFPGTGEHLAHIANAEGYSKEIVRIIEDSNSRPIFEMFRFRH
jgi:hypothetical protein